MVVVIFLVVVSGVVGTAVERSTRPNERGGEKNDDGDETKVGRRSSLRLSSPPERMSFPRGGGVVEV